MGRLKDIHLRGWIKAGHPVAKADGGGLTFTLSAKGTAAWTLRYRFAGKARELTLGRYPELTLARARELAIEKRGQIQQGINVARKKQQNLLDLATAQGFRELATDYITKSFPELAENTARQRRHHIEDVILPRLGHLPACEVTTSDVVALIDAVGQRSRHVAKMVFTATSQIFQHGVARHVVETNPCAGISVAAICGKPRTKRPRLKLTSKELGLIVPALHTIGAQNALAVKLLLVTCTRIGELARAEWTDIDFSRAEWVIPDAHSKSGQGFTVPLPCVTVGWLQELERFACGSRFVLPARQQRRLKTYGREMPFEQRTLNAMLHKLCSQLEGQVRRFTPHDLRSTARSHLAELGVNVIVAERCLNHSLGGLIAVYDQHDYLNERRAALELWASLIQACETGQAWNVIPLQQSVA